MSSTTFWHNHVLSRGAPYVHLVVTLFLFISVTSKYAWAMELAITKARLVYSKPVVAEVQNLLKPSTFKHVAEQNC